ncbi:hypothetical protein [Leucobacter komagatae]|uniref:Uncharacterized protein n=1 Tax=Leucobacter komagatae TaxID=55969 RepID=A0A0D0IJL9_9MICO|nr:hypothetical protein [Leucobacter komagatae]KIP51242.1 hypothetical protein SD72_16590 [Leucobacter komagatae]
MSDAFMVHRGVHNCFAFTPEISHEHLLQVSAVAERLGYSIGFRQVGETTLEIQERLREEGPSAYLDVVSIQEDVSPRAPAHEAEHYVISRLGKLNPKRELAITDPYLFTNRRVKDADAYAASLVRIMSPLLTNEVTVIAVVSEKQTDDRVQGAVTAALKLAAPDAVLRVVVSEDFHDRFWIADRETGVIMGTSLNKIGGKIFFMDKLSNEDVRAVVHELDEIHYKGE